MAIVVLLLKTVLVEGNGMFTILLASVLQELHGMELRVRESKSALEGHILTLSLINVFAQQIHKL